MPGDGVYFAPMESRSNILVCQKGDPFDPVDLANMFIKGIITVDNRGVSPIGTVWVEHWRIEDAWRQSVTEKMVAGGGSWRGTTRTMQKFDKNDVTENLPVVVFHTEVDPETWMCASCGRSCRTVGG